MNNSKKKKAFGQLCAHFSIWCGVGFVHVLVHMIRNGPSTPFPKNELLKLITPNQLLVTLSGGALVFLIMALIRHKSPTKEGQDRAFHFNDLVLDEVGSVLFSFGSLLLMCFILFEYSLSYISMSLACILLGLKIKPSDDAYRQPIAREGSS